MARAAKASDRRGALNAHRIAGAAETIVFAKSSERGLKSSCLPSVHANHLSHITVMLNWTKSASFITFGLAEVIDCGVAINADSSPAITEWMEGL
jgi:hypothetical protein